MPLSLPHLKSATITALLIVGCIACSKKDDAVANPDGSAPAAPAAATTPAAPAAATGSTAEPSDTKYKCSSNIILPVSYKDGGLAVLTYKDKTIEMRAPAGEPTRFIGDGKEWWVNGRGQGGNGNLYTQNADGTAGEFIEGCVENPDS